IGFSSRSRQSCARSVQAPPSFAKIAINSSRIESGALALVELLVGQRAGNLGDCGTMSDLAI
ncbi:hypothetical protein, partial [Sphingomonas sp. Ant20]|uniref:hypothetical protein n=1 Tax=Sphingomonas sp. Ant20 TaxID=104605 RepID=UPI002740FFC4